MRPTRRIKVFFDGGCRPNPGPIEAAVVMRGAARFFGDLGSGSNADAEWLALLQALELVRAEGLRGAELIGDSRPVIETANRILKSGVAPDGRGARLLLLAGECAPARIRWIKREQNLAGIALASRHPR